MIDSKGTNLKQWTDHNLHDPGITLLEHLAYAITDLNYRLGFKIEDLLAEEGQDALLPFFTARQILPQAPLTISDYRKCLIDLEDVKNAWLEPLNIENVKNTWTNPFDNNQPLTIWYNETNGEWNFEKKGKPIDFKGFYQVNIETENPLTKVDQEKLKGVLAHNRNLCEDFFSINILPPQYIGLHFELEIKEDVEIEHLQTKIEDIFTRWVSPSIRFYTLKDMQDKGYPTEEIFQGPLLLNGFIDEGELKRFNKKTALRGSDALHLLMDLPEIKTVQAVKMGSSLEDKNWSVDNLKEKQYLSLSAAYAPQLAFLSLRFFKQNIPVEPEPFKSADKKTEPSIGRPSPKIEEDIPVPKGKYRNLGKFFSIAHDLPHIYGIGREGLLATADTRRQAQANQLKGYIAIFEQLLANYLGQVAHFKELFHLQNNKQETYSPQLLDGEDGIPQYDTLLKDPTNHFKKLNEWLNTTEISTMRSNRILNHLLARFGEKVSKDVFLLSNRNTTSDKHIEQKRTFLRTYGGSKENSLSYQRGLGMNYTEPIMSWRFSNNYSGLEKRLRYLLAIQESEDIEIPNLIFEFPQSEINPQKIPTYRFRVVEKASGKILLSSQSPYLDINQAKEALQWTLQQARWDDNYQRSTTTDGRSFFNILSPTGTVIARRIEYFKEPAQQEEAIGYLQKLLKEVLDMSFPFYLVEHHLIRPLKPNRERVFPEIWTFSKKWTENQGVNKIPEDPWSLQLSLVFQDDVDTRKDWEPIINQLVNAETPVHLTSQIVWLKPKDMKIFKKFYFSWRQNIANNDDATKEINTLNDILHIARNNIPYHGLGLPTQGSYMTCPNTSLPDSNQITISFWAKISAPNSSNMHYILHAFSSKDPNVIPLSISFSQDKVAFICEKSGKIEDKLEANLPEGFFDQWHHWAFVKNIGLIRDDNIKIFLNGSLLTSKKSALAIPQKDDILELCFGNKQVRTPPIKCYLADIRIWKIARKVEDINNDKDYRIDKKPPLFKDLHAYWKLDEGGGNEAHDFVEDLFGKNNGTIFNPEWI